MATPVPPPAPRHLRLLRLLLSGLVLGAALNGAAAGRPDVASCPGSLDCALKRRARCPPGAQACGPCLRPFQEDQQGLCVPRMRRPLEESQPQPRLEDEIDFLAQELALKEAGHPRLAAQPLTEARPQLLEPAALGFSERGQGLELGLLPTRGGPAPTAHTSSGSPVSSGPVHMSPLEPRGERSDGLALVLMVAFCVAGAAALAMAALCWCRLQRETRLTQKADYTATKTPGSPATPRVSPGDQRLAHSAEMYHYQHQRQQMLCLERPAAPTLGSAVSSAASSLGHCPRGPSDPTPPRHKEPPKELDSASSDEENEDGDFTVYECPGLAPTGEMEVRNPLFDHSSLSAPLPEPRSPPALQ